MPWFVELARLLVQLGLYFAQKRTPSAMADIRQALGDLKKADSVQDKELASRRIHDWLSRL